MFCASVAYPVQPDGRFDFDYFATQHIPLFARLLGANCVRAEVHKSLATPGAPAPQFIAVAHLWVTSADDFGATLARHGAEIYGDIPRFTDIAPLRQWSDVMSIVG